MRSIIETTNAIGREELAATLDVGMTAISNAVVRGKFPATWYVAVKALAESKGVECPDSLFAMRQPVFKAAVAEQVGGEA